MAILIAFSSCKKTAVKGDKGDPGAAGPAATSMVSSTTFTVSTWFKDANCWKSKLTVSAITQSVLDSGTVAVDYQEGNQWEPLPSTVNNIITSYEYSYQSLTIVMRSVSGTINLGMPLGNFVYKVVVISK